MIKYARGFFAPVSYLGNSPTLNDRGAPQSAFASPVSVLASVQSRKIEMVDAKGGVVSRTAFTVYLRDDPATLNGGLGVIEEDAFELPTGEFMQAVARPVPESMGTNCVLWRVECLDMA